ncbi:GNAT family N-acetyltransferase [Clostridium sediminicola]|uniref:GNAT family N-acetyltransferase n=1 Tax=Clostridium sediminicola TaxID=3114879 RepID=UPI0031F205E1
MNWKIKKFNELTTIELYNVLKERINIFVVEQDCPYSECDDKDLEGYHIYCEDKGEIIAYARILPRGIAYKELSMGRILVRKDHRGENLGYDLMKRALIYIETELDETEVKISAQKYAEGFYNRLGFKTISEVYLEDEIPHIKMLYKKQPPKQ